MVKIAFAAIALLALVTVVDVRHRPHRHHHSCAHHWWVDHDLTPCKKVHR